MRKIYFIGHGQGTSMQPIINEGDKLFLEKVKFSEIKVGDIVVFYQRKKLIGHRVIKKNSDVIITKGDNIPFFDKPLKKKEILGKLLKIEGKYGIINLDSTFARLINKYFLFYNYATYYLPLWLRIVLVKILRGRKFLVRFMAVLTSSK